MKMREHCAGKMDSCFPNRNHREQEFPILVRAIPLRHRVAFSHVLIMILFQFDDAAVSSM
jgi:hypothetical protein